MIKSYSETRRLLAMNKAERRTISLPAEHADFIDEKVASGAFASASEVVRAGLRALQERDAAIERWLKEEVAPAYDALQADPSRAKPMADVMEKVRKLHASKLRGAA
jgi:antitoxin ParD1/3/4